MKVDNKYWVRWTHKTEGEEKLTECEIIDEQSKDVISSGMAFVHPKDNFDKEIGRKLSLARAIRELSKDLRRKFWETYRTHGKQRW